MYLTVITRKDALYKKAEGKFSCCKDNFLKENKREYEIKDSYC